MRLPFLVALDDPWGDSFAKGLIFCFFMANTQTNMWREKNWNEEFRLFNSRMSDWLILIYCNTYPRCHLSICVHNCVVYPLYLPSLLATMRIFQVGIHRPNFGNLSCLCAPGCALLDSQCYMHALDIDSLIRKALGVCIILHMDN